MSRLKRLIQEIHRRSLWQVLGIYLGGAWVALQGIEALVSVLGLPEWVPGFALVALIVGLPIVLATAFVQEGLGEKEAPGETEEAPTTADAGGLHLVLTWRNVLLGGVVVIGVAGIAVAVALYLARWTRAPTGPPLTSIAVLPFNDMSPAGDQGWLANGMSEELIEALSRIEALRVMARTSAFALRGEDIQTIGAKLEVGSVVEGSVRRSGDELRITAQLIRVADGSHLWSGRYDRTLADVFAIQGEIAREIAEALRSELDVGDTWSWMRRARYTPRDVRAYELVKAGTEMYGDSQTTEEEIRTAIGYFRRALAIDPEYAQAHAELGYAYFWRANLYSQDAKDFARAREEAERALAIDATNGSAHNLRGEILVREWNWEEARRTFERGIEHEPGHGPLQLNLGLLLMEQGEPEQALIRIRSAVDLDPLHVASNGFLGIFQLIAGDYTAAARQLERTRELAPTILWVNDTLLLAYHYAGMEAELLEAMEVNLRDIPEELAASARAGYEQSGYPGLCRAALQRRVAQSGKPCTEDPLIGAHLYALTGEPDRMYDCIDATLARRGVWGMYLKLHPNWAPYRDDPRFTALLRRVRLEE